MTRLPAPWSPGLLPGKVTAQTTPSRSTIVAHISRLKPPLLDWRAFTKAAFNAAKFGSWLQFTVSAVEACAVAAAVVAVAGTAVFGTVVIPADVVFVIVAVTAVVAVLAVVAAEVAALVVVAAVVPAVVGTLVVIVVADAV